MEVLGEFDPALPMGAHYCSNQLTAEEYEKQGSEATRQALLELQEAMKQNPELYRQVLGKKRIDEGNVFSKLKGKLMTAVKGDEYGKEKVTEFESHVKMAELHEEMFKVFEYAQEERTMTRKSKRLAEKRAKKEQPATPDKCSSGEGDTYTTPPQFVPPPPPPYPPPVATPMALRERTNMQSTSAPAAKKKTSDKNGVHSELLASNQMLRLRPTRVKRSPGGTPYYRPRHARQKLKAVEMSYDSIGSFNLSSPFSLFNCSLLQKFRNARSPASPADHQQTAESPHSPANFSP
ncbi:Hypp3883 [Branchiostoma lanceolatum]|uniref:Hypp3883 protein n=1 Tax=Branchiostoma lanceolatum TaxID=7740 RepID=A0A8K0A396_BRALA|nr:Hypp3883 [Branchiostoma lanceolatum]